MTGIVSAIEQIAELVEANHVDPVAGRTAADAARQWIEWGDPAGTSVEIARQLTDAMRDRSADGHIYVEAVDREDPTHDWIGEWLERGPAVGWGVSTWQFGDDVGVLAISSFYPLDHSAPAIDDALASLNPFSRWILDLSDNGGGDEDAADAIIATFLPHLPSRAYAIRTRAGRTPAPPPPQLPWTQVEPDRTLAIVVDRRTFSAPEAVAFALQEHGRASVVGEPTAGGANMLGDPFAIGESYRVGIPMRTPVGLRSGTNWEGVGVQPDVVVHNDHVEAAASWLSRDGVG